MTTFGGALCPSRFGESAFIIGARDCCGGAYGGWIIVGNGQLVIMWRVGWADQIEEGRERRRPSFPYILLSSRYLTLPAWCKYERLCIRLFWFVACTSKIVVATSCAPKQIVVATTIFVVTTTKIVVATTNFCGCNHKFCGWNHNFCGCFRKHVVPGRTFLKVTFWVLMLLTMYL